MNKSKLPELMTAEAMQTLLRDRMPLTQIPKDFYCVLQLPALLAGMRKPDGNTDWKGMSMAGFRYVMNLAADTTPKYDPSPLRFLCEPVELENLNKDHQDPTDPECEEGSIRKIVCAVIQKLNSREGVVIHCWGGRGRTGTVLGCTLKKMGYSPKKIEEYLRNLNVQRGKDQGWPESPWQSWLLERF